MVVLPTDIPVTTPEADPIVATDGLLLSHDIPLPLALNVVVLPTQTLEEPIMPGRSLTVTTIVATTVPHSPSTA
jgi:hypothetical protein